MNKFMIGWSEINITPKKKCSLAGQFAERISEYVEKPLTATAMAVSAGDEQMILVSVDLVAIGYNLVDALRHKLANNAVGLDPMKVVWSAIHTHTGPKYPYSSSQTKYLNGGIKAASFRSLLESMLPPDKKYIESANVTENPAVATGDEVFELLVERLSKVVLDAWAARKTGGYANAFGRAAVGMCRRTVYSDGSAQMWGDSNTAVFAELESASDSGIELMYTYDADNKLTGIVANLACPAQCVQHRLFVSPDFWGEVKLLLRKYFGEEIFLLPLCGPAGDQCPVDLVRWVEPESDVNDPNLKRNNSPARKADPSMFDLAGMRKVGKRIAREIIELYDEGLDTVQMEGELVHQVHNMQLPIRRVTMSEYNTAKKAIEEYLRYVAGDVDFNDTARLQIHLGTIRRYILQEKMDILDTEVHIMKFGSVAIATNPFELFLNYGNQIKARSNAEQTFLIQLANGAEGYLPTEKAEKGGHYSAFVSSGQVGHIGGEQLVRQTVKNINKLFSR